MSDNGRSWFVPDPHQGIHLLDHQPPKLTKAEQQRAEMEALAAHVDALAAAKANEVALHYAQQMPGLVATMIGQILHANGFELKPPPEWAAITVPTPPAMTAETAETAETPETPPPLVIESGYTPHFHAGRRESVAAIVIHVTEGSEAATRSWFAAPTSKVSAHYLVCVDGRVVQFVAEGDEAWAQGRVYDPTAVVVLDRPGVNPNTYCIAIEHEGDGHHDLTDAQRASSVRLIREIAARHGLPITRDTVIGHHEIYAKKSCPGAIDVVRLVREAAS